MRFKSIFILSFLVVFFACKKDLPIKSNMHYDYFPTKTGHTIIYNADSIVYNDFNDRIDTFTYQLKEVIDSTFIDLTGQQTQRLEIYKRANDSAAWQIYKVWTSKLTASTAEKVEDNLRFLKLAFPISADTKWAGNSYINPPAELEFLKDWEYVYSEIHTSKTINTINFDSTVTVIGIDDSNFVEKNYFQEIYAKNIGLISKEWIHLSKNVCDTCNPFDWEKGFIYKLNVKSYSD